MNLIPCRAMVHQDQQHQEKEATTPSVGELHHHVVNDRMPVRCTMSGKHICQFEEEVEEQRPADHNIRSLTPPQQQHEQPPSGDHYKQEELGAKAKDGLPVWEELQLRIVATVPAIPLKL